MMADMEKVIKGLECCTNGEVCFTDCPYFKETASGISMADGRCIEALQADALALLKEQEAVKPIKKDTVEITARYEFDCQCGAPLLIGQPYCADCGRAVKWND